MYWRDPDSGSEIPRRKREREINRAEKVSRLINVIIFEWHARASIKRGVDLACIRHRQVNMQDFSVQFFLTIQFV
jgi:hypothetical protein